MLNQIAVNPATEQYTFTQVVNMPIFVGAEITQAVANLLRMNRIKDQVGSAMAVASEAGFYFANHTEDILVQLRASFKNLMESDQALKTAVLAATEVFTLKTTLASSQDGATQSITFVWYVGSAELLRESRVKAVNSFVATASARLLLNNHLVA